jgi:phosphonate transport system ATP-binding protein
VDPARARDTIALLVELSRERGLTFVSSIHDIALAREFFPRLVGLREGRIAFDERADRVHERDIERLYALDGLEHIERGRG